MTEADLDLMDPVVFRDGIPHDYFRALRRSGRLTQGRDKDGEPFWNVVRHQDVAMISRDAIAFASSPTTMTSVRKQPPDSPIITFLDAPDHTRMRRLTSKAFAPSRLAALDGRIAVLVRALLDEAVAKGDFDLAEDVALRLHFEVLAELIGLPEGERQLVLGWAGRMVNLDDEPVPDDVTDGLVKLHDYFLNLASVRARKPADDLCSALLATRLKNPVPGLPDRLSEEEVGTFAATLITAGSETTYAAITGAVLALSQFPDQQDQLRADPGLIPGAVAEVLRWVTPVTHFARRAVIDTEISGQRVRAGERVVMWYSSANRDEEVFSEPERFNVTRSPNPQLSFGGGGPHVCIASALATMELRHFLDRIVGLLPGIEIAGDPVRPETNFMNSIKCLPMRVR
jgi:cholest-4-en-3-one 26-monooxygenase